MTTLEVINNELASRVMPDIEYISLLNTKVEILQAIADSRLDSAILSLLVALNIIFGGYR